MDKELIRLLRSYNKQTSINVIKNRNCGAPLLGLAKYIYIYYFNSKQTLEEENEERIKCLMNEKHELERKKVRPIMRVRPIMSLDF